ncbi:MAG TPA: hypothetical protein ENK21_09925 [Trueperaceae bacterium]|nr:hypothetical protein [Trueperaceae bacterium]
MLAILLQGLGLGFSAAVMPGSFQTYLISESLLKGYKKALPLAFVPILSDLPIIIITMLVLNQAADWFLNLLQIVGGIFIIYLSFLAYKSSKNDSEIQSSEQKLNILKAITINFLNPNVWLYWSTIGATLLISNWQNQKIIAILFLLSFYGAMVLSNVLMVLIFGKAAQTKNKLRPILLSISTIFLFAFGMLNLYQGLAKFL